MKVLVVDNYDSFTYNLVQYFGELGADPVVIRNDEMSPVEGARLRPDRLVVSPGPGTPQDAGYSMEYVRTIGTEVPTLGVCLGHQAIVAAFGGTIGRAPEPRHGKVSRIEHDDRGVFWGLENPFEATRYHSLTATSVPDVLEVTARSEDGVVQGVRHRQYPIEGVQFHPESIMTTAGKDLLANFLGRRSVDQ
ncbi:MAG TPA: aminodeoxychorismate/anthranilate synthase component II [Acidimicrobiia bacterium]|nr:aminodeoxychorismate/anthranilate synthase component II [Acidimicrobiia bacterium]